MAKERKIMEYTHHLAGNRLHIALKGNFMAVDHVKFRDIIEAVYEDKVHMVMLDLRLMEHIDAAGLGMMMVINEEAKNTQTELVIINMHEHVADNFRNANIYNDFNITAHSNADGDKDDESGSTE